jgi:hypothetical protein
MRKMMVVLGFLFGILHQVQAQSALLQVMQVPLGSSTALLQSHANTSSWRLSSLTDSEKWSRDEAEPFNSVRRSIGSQNVDLFVYNLNFMGQSVEIFFFYNRDRLFAINFFVPTLTSTQFIQLVQEIGGSQSSGYLGYGRPIEIESQFVVYMWYLNRALSQTLIMTYFGESITPNLKIQISDEALMLN